MSVILKEFKIQTKPFCDILNITPQVEYSLNETKLKDGIVCVHVAGSTAAISTLEYEPGLVKTDINPFFEAIYPYETPCEHHQTWNDQNGVGHIRSFLIGTSKTFPFTNGRLILGTWQQIVFVELDEKPRSRTIFCQFIGN